MCRSCIDTEPDLIILGLADIQTPTGKAIGNCKELISTLQMILSFKNG